MFTRLKNSANAGSRTVLITGCSSGFGYLAVPEFLAQGWRVIATLRNLEQRRDRFQALLDQYGENRLILAELDVTDPSDHIVIQQRIETQWQGALDCLVHNAGYGTFGPMEETPAQALKQQMEVCFFGPAELTRRLLPALRRRGGRVLFVSSILGLTGLPFASAYCASKFAIEGLAEALWYEAALVGIQVGILEPGGFSTEFRSNLEWNGNSSGPYARPIHNYLAARKAQAERRRGDPRLVVRTLLRLASKPKIPLRTVIGRDAVFTAFFRKWLPQSWFLGASRSILSRILLR